MKKNTEKDTEKYQNYVNILGIKVLSTTTPHLLASVRENITHNYEFGNRSRRLSIMTPNPELVLASTKNKELKVALNSANFSVPDGVGLNYASKFLFGTSLNIIPGRKLFLELIGLANKKGWRVFFLGGYAGEAEKAAENLRKNYKSVKIETFAGPWLNNHAEPVLDKDKVLQKETFQLINKFEPKLLFVAFQNPKQEIWVYKNLKYLNVGGAMTVGGTFRYIAGMSKLPPAWLASLGLEWLWRLITEPKRIGRIFNAFPLFPLRVFWFKVTGR